MNKGVLLEIKDKYLIVLTSNGEFIKALKEDQDYEIGREIYFQVFDQSSFAPFLFSPYLKKGVALTMACLLFIVPFFLSKGNDAYAYMVIDGASDFELALDEEMNVIDIKTSNGKKILHKIGPWKGKKAEEVSKEIVHTMGGSNGKIVMDVYSKDETNENSSKIKKLKKKLDTRTPEVPKEVSPPQKAKRKVTPPAPKKKNSVPVKQKEVIIPAPVEKTPPVKEKNKAYKSVEKSPSVKQFNPTPPRKKVQNKEQKKVKFNHSVSKPNPSAKRKNSNGNKK